MNYLSKSFFIFKLTRCNIGKRDDIRYNNVNWLEGLFIN